MTSSSDYWQKRAKGLTQALIISGTLNVALFSTFLYLVLRDQFSPLVLELKPAASSKGTPMVGMQELLLSYQSIPLEELVEKLAAKEHVEAGYAKRDLALAALVGFHHFNLERALGGLQLQKRLVEFRDPKTLEKWELTIYPGLADYQYQALIQYAKTERWPLTAEGLFLAIKRSKSPYDNSLLEAFSLTSPFHFIHTLFAKTGAPLRREQIASLISAGNWEMIRQFSDHLRTSSQFDSQNRRQLLIQLMAEKSQLAAALLLQTDPVFTYKKFDDQQMVAFLSLLGMKTPQAFAKALLVSPRSDLVWKRAAALLYSQAGEPFPEPYDHRQALARFIYGNQHQEAPIAVSSPTPSVPNEQVHEVVSGDTIWQIARLYKRSVDELRSHNRLESDQLVVGQLLKIPRQSPK